MNRNPRETTSFPGIGNMHPESASRLGMLREADNADLVGDPEQGIRPRRREGYTKVIDKPGSHSFWGGGKDLRMGFFVSGEGVLTAMFEDESEQDLLEGVSITRPMSFDRVNDRTYFTNGEISGMIMPDLDVLPWGVEGPPATPNCAAEASAGGLDEGTYRVGCTFIDRLGRESGTGESQPTDVVQGGGIMLTQIPQPADSVLVPTIRIYVSSANGKKLYRHADVPTGTDEFLVAKRPKGVQLATQFLFIMPPGHITCFLNGQHLVARGRELLISPALRFGMVDPARGRIGFPKRISMAATVGDSAQGAGVYVASGDRTWFLAGANLNDRDNVSQRIVKSAGAIPGTLCKVDADILGFEGLGAMPIPVWLSTAGQYCAGLPGGNVTTFRLKDAVTDVGARGATMFRESKGHRHIITSLQGATPAALRVSDRVTVTEYKHYEDGP